MARREERPIAIAGAEDASLALEGIFVAGEGETSGGAVVAPPHPLYGGNLESPVVGEVAHACAKAGQATVRFNWRGVGASAGERSGELVDAVADYGAALAHLADTADGALVAAGYSFGAVTGLQVGAAHPRVERMILVCPPGSMLDRAAVDAFGGRALVVAGGRDELAPPAALEALLTDDRYTLEVIPEADHFFMDGLGSLGRIVSEWLERG